MSYKERRKSAKRGMSIIEGIVEEVLEQHPVFRNLGNHPNGTPYINGLIRYIWATYGDYNARSIIRFYPEVMNRHPEWDTKHNIENRANAETAYHERFRKEAQNGAIEHAKMNANPPITPQPQKLFNTSHHG